MENNANHLIKHLYYIKKNHSSLFSLLQGFTYNVYSVIKTILLFTVNIKRRLYWCLKLFSKNFLGTEIELKLQFSEHNIINTNSRKQRVLNSMSSENKSCWTYQWTTLNYRSFVILKIIDAQQVSFHFCSNFQHDSPVF